MRAIFPWMNLTCVATWVANGAPVVFLQSPAAYEGVNRVARIDLQRLDVDETRFARLLPRQSCSIPRVAKDSRLCRCQRLRDQSARQYDVGVTATQQSGEIATIERVDESKHGVEVLLRHRLLLKPGGFEDAFPLQEEPAGRFVRP